MLHFLEADLSPLQNRPRVPVGTPRETDPEQYHLGVEQFPEMLRLDQRRKPEELPGI